MLSRRSSLGRLAILCLALCLVSAGADKKKKPGRAKGPAPAPPAQDGATDGGGLPPPHRRVVPAPPPLVNLTGTYRGEWQLASAWPPRLRGSGPLQHGSGVVVVKLRAAVGNGGVLHSVEGEMVLRNGQYVSSGDVLLTVQGVHVAAAGKLVAVVEPTQAMSLPSGLFPTPESHSSGSGEAEDGGAQERSQVLRTAALQVALLASVDGGDARDEYIERDRRLDEEEEEALLSIGGGAHPRFQKRRSWEQCTFVLELGVTEMQDQAPAVPQGLHAWRIDDSSGGIPFGEYAGGGSSGGEGEGEGDPTQLGGGLSWVSDWMLGRRAGQGPAFDLPPRRRPDLALHGTLVGQTCGVRLAVSLGTAHVEEYASKAVNYTVMLTALGFFQVILLVRQMEAAATPALAARVSLLTLAHQAVLDAYLCLVHLTLGIMVESLTQSFGTVALMQFCVFAVFEMRFLLCVWRARRGAGVDPWSAQREVSVLYLRFYAALLGGILLTYQLQRYMAFLLFPFFSFWLPQIVLCVRSDCRQPLRPEFALGTSAARLALPLYIYGCPTNLLRVAPNPALCAALVGWVGLQCGVLLVQHYWGPRSFIPKPFLPRRYDYSRPVPIAVRGSGCDAGNGRLECVICMGHIDCSSKAQRCVTPCSHVFHRWCLERWHVVKQECPTCRRVLPPL